MEYEEIISKVKKEKIVAVIRANNADEALKIAKAVSKGGIHLLEMTMTVPGALDIIKELSETVPKNVVVGAGTVLDAITARMAILNGAKFIVAPSLDLEVMKICNLYRVPSIAGAATPNEVLHCLEAGSAIIKLFPGNAFPNPKIIKSIHGPFPQANIMPTGGVSLDNVKAWLDAGAVCVGTGGSLTAGAKTGDFKAVTEEAKKFVAAVS
ncbi:bifunctional 2-keto-4-hydroxyglutarate aldolase/2-keto-3-deoxy-6-phosphogluconate aldolase [Lacticaseibacillus rhamnosus]|uniref:bifunctional 2-keto-4-hydroxyglutarate aldolase/2-keto-3-deoxy-6-phosphogluconate aldolase n=1 Tax=Lacticaseibacillus rhamnosus TaxID=47715 RepID=UPI002FBEE52F